MPLSLGSRLGPYEIAAPLGAGGMGEVWKARDTRLERWVAVKVLPQRALSSEELKRRFEREAKAVAQLSHPHICALYDVGREGDVDYLVMEYLEGETLADRLARGPLPLAQTLRYGTEIADALEKAHRQGIVHRDLKPGNVMLTKSGVKLLDFGLAHAVAAPSEPSPLSALPTQEKPLTAEGTILGTVQYMAPEQLEGKAVDGRTDIFAFGAVLYEMATGRKAFTGSSHASIMADILHVDPPPLSSLAAASPPALDRVVRTCLAKDPDARWQSAADVGRELEWIGEDRAVGAVAGGGAPAPSRRRERVAWSVAAIAAAAVAAAVFFRPSRKAETPTRFSIAASPGQMFMGFAELSPDGRNVALLMRDEGGRNSIGVRPLDGLELRKLAGTDDARGMFWSPDGKEIGFFAEGKLKRIAAGGGPARVICDSGGAFSGKWSPRGTILFEEEFGRPLVAVSASGGTPAAVTALDRRRGDSAHGQPNFLPDGRHFLYFARNVDPDKGAIMLGSLDSKEARLLFPADSGAVYADPGYVLFARGEAVFAWKLDLDGLRLVGEPFPAFEGVHSAPEDGLLSLSAAGDRVAYLSWSLRRSLVWVDRKGRELGTLGEAAGWVDVRISPDGRRVAVTRRDPSHARNQDVWVLDAARGTETRITAERSDEFDPAWTPDGERLVYVSDRFGFYDLFERPASGGAERIVFRTEHDKVLPSLSPDGRSLLMAMPSRGIFSRALLPLPPAGEPRNLSGDSRSSEEHPEISPDGRWTAFESTESGKREVYVQDLSGGPKRQVSLGGGQMPVWARNDTELFFEARNGLLMSAPLTPGGGRLEIGEPQPLFPLELGISAELHWLHHPYDVSPDGQRFLVIRRAPDTQPDGAVVVTNWTAAIGVPR